MYGSTLSVTDDTTAVKREAKVSVVIDDEDGYGDDYVDSKRKGCIIFTCTTIAFIFGVFLYIFISNGYYKMNKNGNDIETLFSHTRIANNIGSITNEDSSYYTDCSYDSLSQWVSCDTEMCQVTGEQYGTEAGANERCTLSYCESELGDSDSCSNAYDTCDNNESSDNCCSIEYNVEYNSTSQLYYCVCSLNWCQVTWNTTSAQCFDANSNVIVKDNDNDNDNSNNKKEILLKDVELGDYILSGMNNQFSRVVSVIHKNEKGFVNMRQLCFESFNVTDNEADSEPFECITLTYDHLLYINGINYYNIKSAKDVNIGDTLWNEKINNFSKIVKINENILSEYRWIATENGNIIVNNVLSSNFIKLHERYFSGMFDHLLSYYGFYMIQLFDKMFYTNIAYNLEYLIQIEMFFINFIESLANLIEISSHYLTSVV